MMGQASQNTVVLIHGLASPRWTLSRIARHLRERNYRVINWGYPSIRRSIKSHAAALRELLLCEVHGQLHLVTHSMGGIVARYVLSDEPSIHVGRFVMLTPPNRGSFVARRVAPYLGWLCRPLGELSDEPTSLVNRLAFPSNVEIGIIAAALDRVVRLDSTMLPDQRDHIVLPGHHGVLPLRRDAVEQVLVFLETGRFRRAADKNSP